MQRTDYSKHRQAAIAWMNSQRDFQQGIQVLEASGFRPVVVANLKKRGETAPAAMARLKHLIRTLINAWAQPGEVWDDTDLEAGIIQGQQVETETSGAHMSMMEAYDALNSGQLEHYPVEVKNVIIDYRNAYVQREVIHRELAELSEDNSEELCRLRREKSDRLADLSNKLEQLYPQFIAYIEEKKIPAPELPAEETPAEPVEEDDDVSVDYDQMTLQDLKKLKKSLSTKVIRALNRLNYQQETKAEQMNPMPDGPERVKYETKIRRLSAQIEEIKMAIAKHA